MKNDKLINDILDIIGRTKDGEAISYLKDELKSRGWKRLGNNNDFTSLCEKLGFVGRRVEDANGNIRATYITL